MRRVWAAAALFAVVLFLSIGGLFTTGSAAGDMLERTERIETAVRQGDEAAALQLTEAAVARWEDQGQLLCAFLSHSQLETMDKELAGLSSSLEAGKLGLALEHCAQIRLFCRHLQKLDLPLWENIL